MYINSPGGNVIDGFGLIDTMGMIKSNIVTIGTGMAASMGSLLISSGTRGKRKALQNTWVMLHQLSSGFSGKFRDIIVEAEFCKKLTDKLYNHLAQRTGRTYDEIKAACENGDNWLSAEEARNFGLIDEVIYPNWD
jgi:ATP-dependent Clp protease protease subunit